MKVVFVRFSCRTRWVWRTTICVSAGHGTFTVPGVSLVDPYTSHSGWAWGDVGRTLQCKTKGCAGVVRIALATLATVKAWSVGMKSRLSKVWCAAQGRRRCGGSGGCTVSSYFPWGAGEVKFSAGGGSVGFLHSLASSGSQVNSAGSCSKTSVV
jgi:hypothetical protein